MLPLMFIITSHLVPTVRDQHPTISLFTNLRELMSPRALISINSLVCGMLFPLAIDLNFGFTSIKFYLKLFFWPIILSATLILTIHTLCISFVLVTNVFLKVTILSNCVVSHLLPREWHNCTRLRLVQLIAIHSCY